MSSRSNGRDEARVQLAQDPVSDGVPGVLAFAQVLGDRLSVGVGLHEPAEQVRGVGDIAPGLGEHVVERVVARRQAKRTVARLAATSR